MQVYGDASLDASNGSQIHCINLTLHLPLTLGTMLDARCGLALILQTKIELDMIYIEKSCKITFIYLDKRDLCLICFTRQV